ncbi:MAG: 3-dehydroquinate synthase, partial [Chloroflexi bacterium]
AELRRARESLYRAVAALRVDVDADPEEVAERVADAVGGRRIVGPEPGGPELHEVHEVVVALGERAYPVLVGEGVAARLPEHLPPSAGRVAVVADRAVIGLARDLARQVRRGGRKVNVIPVSGGERIKTWAAAGRLLDRFAGAGLDRGDCAVAVGGGSVGDLCGFAAASYQRGIAHLQVPTTLLAMVDAAIGGKTGVNLRAGKNLAGAFWQPRAVLCDPAVLGTLPERPYRAALAEIIKTAMIAPGPLPDHLDTRLGGVLARDPATLAEVVSACCALKAEVVAGDEREAGRRAILNYGHTVGHALEAETGYGEALLHGEAVACGLRVAGRLSVALTGCPAADVAWQDGLLAGCGLGGLPEVDAAAVVARTHLDKKARAGTVRWVLLERRGAATTGHRVPDEDVYNALQGLAA